MPKMDNFSYILRINTACQLIFASPRANRARLLQIFIFGLLLREKRGGASEERCVHGEAILSCFQTVEIKYYNFYNMIILVH